MHRVRLTRVATSADARHKFPDVVAGTCDNLPEVGRCFALITDHGLIITSLVVSMETPLNLFLTLNTVYRLEVLPGP